MKNPALKNLLAIVAFLIAFFGIKYGLQSYHEQQAATEVVQSLDQLQTDAREKHPDLPVSVAMQQEAVRQTSLQINAESDEQKRAEVSASMFWGFYFVNVRERPTFCHAQGVDIEPFVKAFEDNHRDEMNKARAIFARSGIDIEEQYKVIEPQIHKFVIQDMQDIAAGSTGTIQGACQTIADNAQALVTQMHFSKMQPTVHQALMSAK